MSKPVEITYSSIAEAIGHLYKDEVIQIYFGESGGTTNYADYDIEQKIFVEGKVIWARGDVILLSCLVQTGNGKIYTKELLINTFAISTVMKKGNDGVQISHIMQGTRR